MLDIVCMYVYKPDTIPFADSQRTMLTINVLIRIHVTSKQINYIFHLENILFSNHISVINRYSRYVELRNHLIYGDIIFKTYVCYSFCKNKVENKGLNIL